MTRVRRPAWACAIVSGVLLSALVTKATADVLPAPAPPLANTEGDDAYARISIDRKTSLTISVETSPGTRVQFRAVRLPEGATLEQEPHPSPRARIDWTPTEDDLGSFDAIVEATDGRTTVRKTIHFTVSDSWGGVFVPAAGASVLVPRASADTGVVYGFPLQLVLATWIRRNQSSGASHGRFYVQVEPLVATKGRVKMGADVAFGFDASFERMPRRRWLIPTYGARLGDFVHGGVPGGNFWHLTPELGAHLWADHGVFVTAALGYVLPIGSDGASMRGPRAGLAITLDL